MDINKVISLIQEGKETEECDFKLKGYSKEKKSSFLKDFMSFSNSHFKSSKYIIFGIKDNKNKVTTEDIVGVDIDDLLDISSLENLLNEYVEPKIYFEREIVKYNEVSLEVIEILNTNHNFRPYVFKKDIIEHSKNVVKKGQMFIRDGSLNRTISRKDLDLIYRGKLIEVDFDTEAHLFEKTNCFQIRLGVGIKNNTVSKITPTNMTLIMTELEEGISSSSSNRKIINKSYSSIKPKDIHHGSVYFYFESNLNIDVNKNYTFKLLVEFNENVYTAENNINLILDTTEQALLNQKRQKRKHF